MYIAASQHAPRAVSRGRNLSYSIAQIRAKEYAAEAAHGSREQGKMNLSYSILCPVYGTDEMIK